MRNRKVAEITLQFIKQYKAEHYDTAPTFKEMASHLNDMGLPTVRGGPWYPSTVQHVVKRYCQQTKTPYPIKRRNRGVYRPQSSMHHKSVKDITITLKITVAHDGGINIVVE